jgi:hypothetical protein
MNKQNLLKKIQIVIGILPAKKNHLLLFIRKNIPLPS